MYSMLVAHSTYTLFSYVTSTIVLGTIHDDYKCTRSESPMIFSDLHQNSNLVFINVYDGLVYVCIRFKYVCGVFETRPFQPVYIYLGL